MSSPTGSFEVGDKVEVYGSPPPFRSFTMVGEITGKEKVHRDEIKDNEGKVIMGGFDGEGYRIKDRQGKEKVYEAPCVIAKAPFKGEEWWA